MKHNKKLSLVNFSSMTNKQNKYLVIHYVGAVSTAKNNADYFYSVNRGASAHYFIDSNADIDQCCWQVVSELNAAWHVGATSYVHPDCRNTNSIGIEICCKDYGSGAEVDKEAEERAVELARSVCEMWDIPRERVLRHFDVTGKHCPIPHYRDNARWQSFLNKVFNTSGGSTGGGEGNMMQIEQKDFERLVKASTLGDRLVKGLGMSGNIADSDEAKIDAKIAEFNQLKTDKSNLENDKKNLTSKITTLEKQVAELSKRPESCPECPTIPSNPSGKLELVERQTYKDKNGLLMHTIEIERK